MSPQRRIIPSLPAFRQSPPVLQASKQDDHFDDPNEHNRAPSNHASVNPLRLRTLLGLVVESTRHIEHNGRLTAQVQHLVAAIGNVYVRQSCDGHAIARVCRGR